MFGDSCLTIITGLALLTYDIVGLALIVWATVYAIHLWRGGK